MQKTPKSEIIQALISLRHLLTQNMGNQFLPGVDAVLLLLKQEELLEQVTFDQAQSIFKNSMGGMGTLGDFVIWNGNQKESSELNQELSKLLKKIGEYFHW
jgi:hypothetical protein